MQASTHNPNAIEQPQNYPLAALVHADHMAEDCLPIHVQPETDPTATVTAPHGPEGELTADAPDADRIPPELRVFARESCSNVDSIEAAGLTGGGWVIVALSIHTGELPDGYRTRLAMAAGGRRIRYIIRPE